MADFAKFPDANLPRDSRPWTRDVEQRITALDRAAERRSEGEKNSSKAQASTMDVLAAQVNDLTRRSSHYVENDGYQSSLFSADEGPTTILTLNVTAADRRKLYVRAGFRVSHYLNGGGSGSLATLATISTPFFGSGYAITSLAGGATSSVSWQGNVVVDQMFKIEVPGTFTFSLRAQTLTTGVNRQFSWGQPFIFAQFMDALD